VPKGCGADGTVLDHPVSVPPLVPIATDPDMLTTDQRTSIEQLLLREREESLSALQSFDREDQSFRDRSGEISLHRFHMADLGTETMEREKEFLFASREGRRLWEIDEALRRLYRNPETFGTCERCRSSIGFDRLEVVPEARFCAACQQAMEDEVA
jgi:DnaK suppressor protein